MNIPEAEKRARNWEGEPMGQASRDFLALVDLARRQHFSLSDVASKLESQVVRNPDLPDAYRQILTTAFAVLADAREAGLGREEEISVASAFPAAADRQDDLDAAEEEDR